MLPHIALIAAAAIAFVLGSIPNGIVVGKLFYHTDIRTVGSGNIGTTNAIRALGKKGGYAVFALDFLKGVLSGAVAWLIAGAALADGDGGLTVGDFLAVAFACCIWGHIFCPWLGFKGGKGIAVAVGCLFATFGPVGALLELASFIVVVMLTKYVSAGSLAAAALCPLFAAYYFWGDLPAWILCTAAALTVVWAHRENLSRLISRTERKIGQ
ncbi:glycerol-3-phosphate 1-O-acyltransferase PlsY [Curtanaerobium respiraculi]|uniref:glycerol-3-phosphate 1-O-acyltransferase PlsY n=1 Tax=Curtanaerobium respiraculi TaxID=2949669 RepID=UPI0024B329B9|nr:glycerol-3-phosphate 1-O-acyltransferase PlsY [Curtanaerobium respiraculi]